MVGMLLAGLRFLPSRATSIAITNVAVSSTGRWIAVGTHNGRTVICDLTIQDSCRAVGNGSGEVNDLQFSPDDRFLAIANRNLQLLAVDDAHKPILLRTDEMNYGMVRFTKDGSRLLTINAQSQIELIDVQSHAVVKTFCCSSFYGATSFFNNDRKIVNAGHWPRVWGIDFGSIKSLAADRQYATFRPVEIDERGRTILMGSQDGRVYVWSMESFALLKRSPAQGGYVDTMAIVPGLQVVAYCSFGKTVHLWDGVGDQSSDIPTLRPSSNIVALPDGTSLLLGTDSGTVEIWDLKSSPHRVATLLPFRGR